MKNNTVFIQATLRSSRIILPILDNYASLAAIRAKLPQKIRSTLFLPPQVNDDGKFQVHPPFGQLLPESESVILVSVYLIDALAFYNKVVIHLEDVKDIVSYYRSSLFVTH